jgi:trimeric autotransporter adhesin
MGRSGSVLSAIILVVLTCALVGCGSSATRSVSFPVPANISLSPANSVSIDVGSIESFTATAQNSSRQTVVETVSFQSSNTAVVTVANNGLACAGTWNSLSAPQICTPGPVGVAQITASAQGVSSPPTTVYVHQHVDNIVVTPITTTPSSTPCVSKDQTVNYAATAFNRGVDITATVGPFSWQSLIANVVKVSTTATGLLPGQAQVTANVPGVTSIFASVGNTNSVPFTFITCPVQSIALMVTAGTATSKSITATVMDSLGTTITGVPLTWSSSNPAAISATGSSSTTSGSIGKASGSAGSPGGASIISSCTPPTCNIGFQPSLPIYPDSVVPMVVSGTGTTQSATVYVASKGCATTSGCVSTLIPIAAPTNTVGGALNLPATPNSLVFDRQGKNVFLGTDLGLFGTKGLMVFNGSASTPTVSEFTGVTGRVLAVSPDGKKVIISDTIATPNQVFVFDTTNNTNVALLITGATAADFSPDSLKAFIVAGSTLYVYSQLDALQSIPLGAAAADVAFLSEGGFAYLAGGNPGAAPAVTVRKTCDNAIATDSNNVQQIISTPATPTFIRTLLDGTHVLAVRSPDIDIISVLDSSGMSTINAAGCTPSTPTTPGTPSVSNSVSSFSLGQVFVPTQLIMSSDGSRAYVLSSNLADILVFDIGNRTSSAIPPLSGNAIPLQATLTPDGTLLYVGASDSMVHVVDTVTGRDIQQISFPQNPITLQGGLCSGVTFTCNPDLIAVRP